MTASNRNVFITGVSSGIGHGLVTEYLRLGWNVFGVSRRATSFDSARFRFKSLDITDEPSVGPALKDLLSDVSRLDLVVLNAGILGELADMKDTQVSQLRHVMNVNVWANKLVLDALYSEPRQISQVVTISSGAAINGNRGWNGYSISKAALNMLTQLYARENETTHFAAVAPGLVDTAMQDYLCGHPSDDRFPSLENLKVRRGTEEMPDSTGAAERLVPLFEELPSLCQSGGFIDIRQIPKKEGD